MIEDKATSSQAEPSKKAKSFQDMEIEKMLVSGEEVILRAQLHSAIYWKAWGILIFAVLMGMVGFLPFLLLFGFVGIIMLCVSILTHHYLLLAVTNKRVLARYGLLQMDVVDIRLSKIESIDLERMLPGHLFGYATVVVMGTGQRVIRVPYISNAESFRRFYNEMVLREEGNKEAEMDIKAAKELEENGGGKSKPGRKKKV